MADEPKTESTTEPAKSGEEGSKDKTFTQADVDRIVSDRVGRERSKYGDYDDLKAKASKLDEMEESTKSEVEKLTGKVGSLTDENKTKTAENLRLRVGLKKGLTGDKAELIDRLQGSTEEELEADADKLLGLVAADKKEEPEKKPDFDGGTRGPAKGDKTPEQEHNEFIGGLLGAAPAPQS